MKKRDGLRINWNHHQLVSIGSKTRGTESSGLSIVARLPKVVPSGHLVAAPRLAERRFVVTVCSSVAPGLQLVIVAVAPRMAKGAAETRASGSQGTPVGVTAHHLSAAAASAPSASRGRRRQAGHVRLDDRRGDFQGTAFVVLAVEHLKSCGLAFVVAEGDCALAGGSTGGLVVVEPHPRSFCEAIRLHSAGRRKELDERRNFCVRGKVFDEDLDFRSDARRARIRTLKPSAASSGAPASKSGHFRLELVVEKSVEAAASVWEGDL